MSWNYRVVRDIGGLTIHEVYYDERGKPNGMTIDEVGPRGETLKELKRSMKLYKQALKRPVLDEDEMGED